MGLYDYGIYQVIKRNARILKDRIALISGDQRISYRQFLENVDRLSNGLINLGLERGDRIGILALNSLEYVYLYGAAAKIGAIMLPINWRLNPQEVEYVISNGSPKVVFAGLEFQAMIAPLISKFGFIAKYFSMGEAEGDFIAFNELMENDGICPEMDVISDDAYVIMHTAAVAGKSRGATLSQKGLIYFNLQLMYSLRLTERDCNLGMLPLFHLGGLSTTLSVMQVGGANIILPKFDEDLALKYIQEDKVTIFGEFPPMLTTLLDKAQEANYDLSSLRAVVGLDQPGTIKRFEETTKATFWAAYGQTETSGLVSLAPYFERPGSAGIPGFMAEVEIVDDYGSILETGKTGEIVVRGPMVFRGYWNLENDNEYTFREGWHHSGDMGSFDSDGFLWYKGRKTEKELIKPGGENVYPAEVEKVILQHPLVVEVSVIGVPDRQWGEAIKAICVLEKGKTIRESELIEFVAARIARFKKPKYVVFVSSLPKTENGLIDREKVKAGFGNA
jgi:acyl-CoA synthetase (AMP-forming)/AMP-acid ligase II